MPSARDLRLGISVCLPRLLRLATLVAVAAVQAPFSTAQQAQEPVRVPSRVRLDPGFDALVSEDATLEKIAEGIAWAEGPVWNRHGQFLLFSDVPNNAILKWKAGQGLTVFLKPSGYTGADPFQGREPGSNGLTYDKQGRLVFCQHGDRRVSRYRKRWNEDRTRRTV